MFPTTAIVVGMLFNSSRFDRIEARPHRMQSDLAQFCNKLGEHKGKLELLTKK